MKSRQKIVRRRYYVVVGTGRNDGSVIGFPACQVNDSDVTQWLYANDYDYHSTAFGRKAACPTLSGGKKPKRLGAPADFAGAATGKQRRLAGTLNRAAEDWFTHSRPSGG